MTLSGCVIPLELAVCRKTAQNSLGKASAELPLHFHTGNSENIKEINVQEKNLLLKTTAAKDNGKSSESKWLFSRLTPEAVAVSVSWKHNQLSSTMQGKNEQECWGQASSLLPHRVGKDNGDNRAKPGGPQLYNIKSQTLQKCNLIDRDWGAEQLREFSVTLQKDLFPFDLPTDPCRSWPHKTRIYEQVHPSAALPTASNHGTLSLKHWSKSFLRGSLLSLFMHQNQTMYKNCRIGESNSI